MFDRVVNTPLYMVAFWSDKIMYCTTDFIINIKESTISQVRKKTIN